MKRPAAVWITFFVALIVAAGVMVFFTVRILDDERAMATAQARAALEETVRLALWRMDSTAAVLLQKKSAALPMWNNSNALPQQQNVAQRFDPSFQQALSANEMQSRQALEPRQPGDWRQLAPILLNRISDILPGASLQDAGAPASVPNDTRLLATIPARLVVPASALPDSSLPLFTPARISLMAAWACAAVAAAAVGRLLSGTLSFSNRRAAFASAVTHELRTPLTTFRMYTEMLASGAVSDPLARQQYLNTLVAESERLAHLIENVLSYSRLENHLRAAGNATVLSVEQLFADALPALRRRADQAAAALHLTVVDPADTCRTDPVAVGQILANLVDNAVKHGRPPISIAAESRGQVLEIVVSDQGPGIGPARVRQLFQPFDKARNDPVPGIGLGLHVSRQLARSLGGELRYCSNRTGSSFVLTLPLL